MNFEIRYIAEDGEIRCTMIENVKTEEEAKIKALDNDMGNFGGDCILKIIDVREC